MNKRVLLPVLLMVTLFVSCSSDKGQEEKASEGGEKVITLVNIVEFHELLEQQKGLQVVDVRTPKEFDLDRIPGAVNIDYWADDFVSRAGHLDKNKPVALYCAAGHRSAEAASKLKEMGFKKIYDLDGGMRAWHTGPPPAQ
ncbi:rhodanese-like domain-containing protein [Fulvivirga kasyanovii]|uniref:Rhodanese-like domain-containing protein n=1 Tax=Fulvivirga kasyanovii TaxID=396812 RepID=A0ABW9RIS8_9BACT|nr:rhodanese-like domain-containing protein [Fulvivirga kasyanovii]MTI23908.1 rhodanese-like domain-containing protein [Fulvivirga kasyanovii]